MNRKRSLSIFLFSLSMMIMLITILRDHVVQGPPSRPGTLYSDITSPTANHKNPRLSQQRINHILYGDHSGGGHLYGVNAPCQAEFPPGWTAKEIIATVTLLAANDQTGWERTENGHYTSEQTVSGVRIKIVLNNEKDDIITAYPVNLPRNACPAL